MGFVPKGSEGMERVFVCKSEKGLSHHGSLQKSLSWHPFFPCQPIAWALYQKVLKDWREYLWENLRKDSLIMGDEDFTRLDFQPETKRVLQYGKRLGLPEIIVLLKNS
ncbi:hypothetical protein FF1_037357 [Malus domestica]